MKCACTLLLFYFFPHAFANDLESSIESFPKWINVETADNPCVFSSANNANNANNTKLIPCTVYVLNSSDNIQQLAIGFVVRDKQKTDSIHDDSCLIITLANKYTGMEPVSLPELLNNAVLSNGENITVLCHHYNQKDNRVFNRKVYKEWYIRVDSFEVLDCKSGLTYEIPSRQQSEALLYSPNSISSLTEIDGMQFRTLSYCASMNGYQGIFIEGANYCGDPTTCLKKPDNCYLTGHSNKTVPAMLKPLIEVTSPPESEEPPDSTLENTDTEAALDSSLEDTVFVTNPYDTEAMEAQPSDKWVWIGVGAGGTVLCCTAPVIVTSILSLYLRTQIKRARQTYKVN